MIRIHAAQSRPFDSALRGRCLHAFGLLVLLVFAAGAQAHTCRPPGDSNWGRWLQEQEDAGGHALACHVNVQVSGLIRRIENGDDNRTGVCREARIASSWSGQQSLINILRSITTDLQRIDASDEAGRHVLDGRAGGKIGTSVNLFQGKKNNNACPGNNSYECKDAYSWKVIVDKARDGNCFLVTAYPE